jgi:glycosyltransferase involved in cell wall biosynthesis
LTLSDAVFHGVPVVTSDTDTVRGSIAHMRNGLRHKVGDATDLKEKLRYALENPAQMDAMSEAARKEFEQRYTWDHVAQEIIENILPRVMQRRETPELVNA